jgi:L-amino acid N-acyltransferase YncA
MAKIRAAAEQDIPRILDLYHELTVSLPGERDLGRPSLEACRKVLAEIAADPRHELLVAEDGGEVAGTAVLLMVPNLSHAATPWALVENIIIDQRFRRRGLARMLLEHAVARARAAGCHRIEIMSDNSRQDAHRLYRSLGFTDSATGFRDYFHR